MSTRSKGRAAERSAVVYLRSRGYKILYVNWACYAGEIDIVAFREKLIFVEVKSVFSGFCSPCELFNSRKKRNLSRAIRKFLANFYLDKDDFPEWQVDLLCLENTNGRVHFSHYENVISDI